MNKNINKEEARKLLEELAENTDVTELSEEAKRLFNAIMTIADERDKNADDLYEANDIILKQKDYIKHSISEEEIKLALKHLKEWQYKGITNKDFQLTKDTLEYFMQKIKDKEDEE